MKRLFLAMVIGAGLANRVGAASDPLAKWAETFDTPETQQAILNKVFPGQVGPLSEGRLNKDTGIYMFPKNGSWVRVEKPPIYVPPASPGGPYFVVTCVFYNNLNRSPVTAVSYVFYDTSSRPEAITAGYGGDETIADLKLPKLGKRFIVLVQQFGMANRTETSAAVIALRNGGSVQTIWMSPSSQRQFQFGFDTLGGTQEELIFRAIKGGERQYSAYRWNGSRFEQDSFASETRLKALPEEVWQYGSPAQ